MQTEPQVSFDDIPVDEAVRDAALEHLDRLETLCRRITGCHVVVSQPHRHHRGGRPYSVRIDLLVPGGEIAVNRDPPFDHSHEDVFVALRDSFAAARRQLEDHVRRKRGGEKLHEERSQGRIAKLFPLHDYGFIETADGREIYFHHHAVSAHDHRLLEIGSHVFFTEEAGDAGPQAAFVQLVHPHARSQRPLHGPREGEAAR